MAISRLCCVSLIPVFYGVNGPLREQTIIIRCLKERTFSFHLHPGLGDGIARRSLSRLAKRNRLKRVRSMEKRYRP